LNRRRLLRRLAQGHVENVPFRELVSLAEGFGYRLARISGSHHLFGHPAVPEPLNLQEVRGEAKGYQVRQLLRAVERYNLRLEDEP
jgi:hypothetical protein